MGLEPEPSEDAWPGPRAIVVIRDEPLTFRAAVVATLEAAGFGIDAIVARGMDAVEHVADSVPDLIVVELGQAGVLGVRLIPVLRGAAPAAVIHALVSLDTLGTAATAAGADGAFLDADLRGLRRAATQLATTLAAARG